MYYYILKHRLDVEHNYWLQYGDDDQHADLRVDLACFDLERFCRFAG